MQGERHIATPVFRNGYNHSAHNPIVCIAITFVNGDFYMVSIRHMDAPHFDVLSSTPFTLATHPHITGGQNVYVYDYLLNKPTPELEPVTILQEFAHLNKYHEILPITALSAQYRIFHHKILTELNIEVDMSAFDFISEATQVLRDIEKNGLAIHPDTFNVHFPDKKKFVYDTKVYTEYHPFTMTGRPSNRFGGINFAALNKSDGSRAAFISRFENGQLLQLDFESYHLRLLANYIKAPLPDIPVHTYLAQQYFEKHDISQEEYDEGKQITFSILYGDNVETTIPLLQNIKKVAETLYAEYRNQHYIYAPYSKRKIYVPAESSMNKVFNYFVQCLEFEETIGKIRRLNTALQQYNSVLVLYTYDAVLLDCPSEELLDVKVMAEQILGENVYPLRATIGTSYDSLTSEP